MPHWRKWIRSAGDERGAITAEYVPLLVVIAVLVVVAVSFVGPWISDQLGDASEPMDENALVIDG